MQNESVRCIIWGGNKALRQLYSAQKRSVCGSDQVRSCDGSIPFLLLCCALSKLLNELEEMDVLNPANITSALPVRAEMAQACFCAFKIRWRKKKKKLRKREFLFTIKPDILILLFFIYEIWNPYSLFRSAWVLSGHKDRSANCFLIHLEASHSTFQIQGDAPYGWESCNKINEI